VADVDSISPDGRWEIVWRITKDFNAYFEVEMQWDIVVRNRATGQEFETFYYEEFANSQGSNNTGVKHVELSADSGSVMTHWVDGRVETLKLPRDEQK